MVRRKVMVEEVRSERCPVCSKQASRLWYIALHVAMKRDDKHIRWRQQHGLPRDYETFREVGKIAKQILEILSTKS